MSGESFHILVVEDDENTQRFLADLLEIKNYLVSSAINGEEALTTVQKQNFDVILLDVSLPDISGIDVCLEMKKNPALVHIPIIFITGYGSVEVAVRAMESGAFYFLCKPLHPQELLLLIERALETSKLHREVASLREQLQEGEQTLIIGKCPSIKKVMTMVAQVAPYDTTVLINGSSGTGKSLIARGIHENSTRRGEPFVAVDCGAIPQNLLESELFGHQKGAFTGATRDRKGIFLRANKGTLFLDEITNLPLELQPKFLRALQEREITPVGSDRSHKVDVRIIAATNMDLPQLVKDGQFREDLFYRLNVFSICLPDLKDRLEDIALLAQYFLDKCHKNGKPVTEFSSSALKILLNYDWPGNIRELENIVEYCSITAQGKEIQPEDLPAVLKNSPTLTSEKILPLYSLQELEKKYIEQVLQHTNYNQTQTAKILQIERKSLWRKLKRFDIKIPK